MPEPASRSTPPPVSASPAPVSHARMPLPQGLWFMIAVFLLATAPAHAQNRHAEWVNHFAKGEKAQLVRATFFGAGGHEEAMGVFVLPDGRVVLYGNSWGPPFPTTPAPTLWGTDSLFEAPLHPPGMETDRHGNPLPPSPDNPNRTGFLTLYKPDLDGILEVRRFGWGVANITAGRQFLDGSLVIAGRATPGFRTWASTAKQLRTVPRNPENERMGPLDYAGIPLPGDVYVAKMSADLQTVEWVWLFEGHRSPPGHVFEGMNGEVVFNCHGVKRISADGATLVNVEREPVQGLDGTHVLQFHFLAVSPRDGTILYGGDHQSPTGREPWRKPILAGYTPEGRLKYRLYDWDGPLVGNDSLRLVSDSEVKHAAFSPDGMLTLNINSDGGNTVATRNPIDLDRPVDSKGIGMSTWGADIGAFTHFTRFDPDTCDHVWYSFFASYTREKPNSIAVEGMHALATGEMLIWGRSASYLVQTPNAFYRSDMPSGGSGPFFTLFNADFSNALFSSILPMGRVSGAADGSQGVVVVSNTFGAKDDTPFENAAPTKDAVQPGFGGGFSDAHILLLRLPRQKETP